MVGWPSCTGWAAGSRRLGRGHPAPPRPEPTRMTTFAASLRDMGAATYCWARLAPRSGEKRFGSPRRHRNMDAEHHVVMAAPALRGPPPRPGEARIEPSAPRGGVGWLPPSPSVHHAILHTDAANIGVKPRLRCRLCQGYAMAMPSWASRFRPQPWPQPSNRVTRQRQQCARSAVPLRAG